MGQELSSRLQVTISQSPPLPLVNCALEKQFVVFTEASLGAAVYDETRAWWRHANVKLPRLQPTQLPMEVMARG